MIRMEFGIIDQIDQNKNYSTYEPKKYGCMMLDDDLYMNNWYVSALNMPTYFHTFSKPAYSFDRWGVTLILPSSLPLFLNIVRSDSRYMERTELLDLEKMIMKAIQDEKHMIHFGV